jgi:hypothetical protein
MVSQGCEIKTKGDGMMKKKWGMALLIGALGLFCQAFTCNVAPDARDTIAANFGYITWAQTQYGANCKANPTQTVCQLVTRDIAAQNLAITALEVYCSGAPAGTNATFANGGPCAPVNSALSALNAAVANIQPLMANIKALTGAPASPPAAPAVPAGGATLEFIDSFRVQ